MLAHRYRYATEVDYKGNDFLSIQDTETMRELATTLDAEDAQRIVDALNAAELSATESIRA